MLRQLRHDVWATQRLMERCRALSEEQLALTAPGTYGTIRRTLVHIVAADERYLEGYFRRLGQGVGPKLDEDHDVLLDEIAVHLREVGASVEKIFADGDFDPDVDTTNRKGDRIAVWVLVTQFAHHGSDHRAHIGTILGAHGLDTPELDVWAYADSVGAIKRV